MGLEIFSSDGKGQCHMQPYIYELIQLKLDNLANAEIGNIIA